MIRAVGYHTWILPACARLPQSTRRRSQRSPISDLYFLLAMFSAKSMMHNSLHNTLLLTKKSTCVRHSCSKEAVCVEVCQYCQKLVIPFAPVHMAENST